MIFRGEGRITTRLFVSALDEKPLFSWVITGMPGFSLPHSGEKTVKVMSLQSALWKVVVVLALFELDVRALDRKFTEVRDYL